MYLFYLHIKHNCTPVSSSSWGLGRAAVCDCGTPWTFLLPFLERKYAYLLPD